MEKNCNLDPSKHQGILAYIESNAMQETHSPLSAATMLACNSMVTLLGELARKVAISDALNAALKQAVAASLQDTYRSILLSIEEYAKDGEQTKAAAGRPKYYTWDEIYTSISQKIVKKDFVYE